MAASDSTLATENAERQRLSFEGRNSACKASRGLIFTRRINSSVNVLLLVYFEYFQKPDGLYFTLPLTV